MSTTVSYKGSTIATVDNNIKTLLTSGKWMEDDLILTDVSGGANTDLDEILSNTYSGAYSNSVVTSLRNHALRALTGLTGVSFPNVTFLGSSVFQDCTALVSANLPLANSSGNYTASLFQGCTHLSAIALPSWTVSFYSQCFDTCSALTAFDSPCASFTGANNFKNCANLKTLVLRKSSICSLGNTSAFSGTPFASGGVGGDIYIPKALYDHLGDNSSSDYKKATNWAIINGYGTITWHAIEGSYYETHYADGTAIS